MQDKPLVPHMLKDSRKNPPVQRTIIPGIKDKFTDIFSLLNSPDAVFPETVFVVGSGPNGKDHFSRIPPNAVTIALNSMITYNRVWDWWLVFDHRIVDMSWWADVRIPRRTKKLFGCRLVNRLATMPKDEYRYIDPDYYFEYLPDITGKKFTPGFPVLIDGLLRGGLTVAGVGIQLAYYGGAEEIVLVGVDMKGGGHFDGFVNEDPTYKNQWPWAERLNKLCRYLNYDRGINISTMSETALHLPRWRG